MVHWLCFIIWMTIIHSLLLSRPQLTNDSIHPFRDVARRWALIHAIHPEVQRSVILTNHTYTVAHLQTIQILAVQLDDGRAIVHHPISGHHPRARPKQ